MDNSPLIPSDSIDALIAQRLPEWLSKASPDQLSHLHQALVEQQRSQQRLQQVLGEIKSLERFAAPLLTDALQAATALALDVRQARLNWVWHRPRPSPAASLPPSTQTYSANQSLLAAALHNFSADEEQPGAFAPQTRLHDATGTSLAIAPETFARICRRLDLGGQYQAYLTAQLAKAEHGTGKNGETFQALLEQSLRLNLTAAVRLAELKGDIDHRSYLQMAPLIAPTPIVPADPAIVVPRQLYLLGKRIEAVVVFEVRRDGGPNAAVDGVLAWIPGDPQLELSRHASWAAFYQALGLRMRQPGYPGFFQRLISEHDRASFTHVLSGLLAVGDATTAVELDGRNFALLDSLYVHLRKARIDRIFADARLLAVPTDDEDRADRAERLQGYLNAGLDLLNLAALFVPGLGLAMLGLAAVQVVGELYEGYEDWQLGDREGALAHVFGVVENVAATAALAVGVAGAGKLLKRVGFVDDLLPVQAAAGQTRLIASDLSNYRLGDLSASSAQQGQWLKLGEDTFQVTQDSGAGTWRIEHPLRAKAYSPRLEHNGRGGWRHALEQPHQWQGKALLLRRLGTDLAEVSEPFAQALLDATGFDEDTLRYLHLEHAPAPARLLDALQRQRLHERFPKDPLAAIEQRMAEAQGAPQAVEQPLLRDFPGLSVRGAREIVGRATSEEQQALLDRRRVPLALAEQARWYLRDSRLDRACAGLRQAAAVNNDTEKLALGLIQAHAPWARDVRIEVRDSDLEGALRAEVGAAGATEVRVIVKDAMGYKALATAPVQAPMAPGLLGALLAYLDDSQLQALGDINNSVERLEDCLAMLARTQRDSAARMIGQAPVGLGLRPLTRLGDGRIGYPLSGRASSSRGALHRAIGQLYPTFTEAQLQAYVSERLRLGGNIWEHVADLQQQLERLQIELQRWQGEDHDAPASASRRRVARRILRCWRRQTAQLGGNDYRLLLEGERFGSLPVLPAGVDFSHVTQLVLRNSALASIDEAFLQRFTGLRQLDLRDNQLQALPGALETMTALEEIDCSGNRIVIDAAGSTRLGALAHLRSLNLSRNPLGTQLDLSGLPQLARLYLRDTGLLALPRGLLRQIGLEFVDLRNNLISNVGEEVLSMPVQRRRTIVLHDNPLPLAIRERLETAEPQGASWSGGLTHAPVNEAARDLWLEHLDAAERDRRQLQWNNLAQEQGAQNLLQLLADLRGTADFAAQRNDLTRRVWSVVDGCEQNSELRQVIFELAARPRSCSDSVALNFSLVEVRAWVQQRISGLSGHDAERAMLRLGRSLFRLDEVDRVAALDIQQRQQRGVMFDEVEVRLAYRTGLAKALGLPGQPQGMSFAAHAGVTHRQLVSARSDVLSSEQTPRLVASLAAREFWQEHLAREYSGRFERVDRPFYAQLGVLEAAQPSVTEQVYLERANALAVAQEAAKQQLIKQLTEESYQRSPW